MGEEFSGLGSTLYIGQPGQPIEEMTEVKLQDASEAISIEGEPRDNYSKSPDGYTQTFTIKLDEEQPKATEVLRYMEQAKRCYDELDKIIAEATILMANWLNESRSIARYNRLRRHYNRWRRKYSTHKTVYAPKFHNFLHGFMVHYIGMRQYHSEEQNCK